MIDLFKRILKGPSTRSLDAAGGDRRWRDDRRMGEQATALHVGGAVVAARASHFTLNTPEGTRAVESLVGNLVGTGIVPRPQHSVPGIRANLAANFLAWSDFADADSQCDFYGMQATLVRDMIVLGEGLVFIANDGLQGAPQLRRLHPEQLDRSKNLTLPQGGKIVQGVEFSSKGKIIAYWIRPSVPGEQLAGLPLTSERYPADAVIHIFRQLVPGQVRGISWFAPILLSGRDFDSLIDAMLVRAKTAAMFVGSLYDPDGSVGGFEGEQTGSDLDITAEPGTIRIEQNGSRLEWSDPPDSGDTVAFSKAIQRRMAAGMGISYEQLTGDYSETTYSSMRGGLIEFRRFAESIQHNVIIHQMCRPIWQKFIYWQVLSGRVSATAFQRSPEQFQAVKWLPPAWAWVDPLKDTQAAILEKDNLLRSRTEIVAERGYDVESLDAEIASDQEREKSLNIFPLANKRKKGGAANVSN